MDKAKEPSKRQAGGYAARRRAAPAPSTPAAPADRGFGQPGEELYAWREAGDPPGTVQTGTAQELAERRRAGAVINQISPTGTRRYTPLVPPEFLPTLVPTAAAHAIAQAVQRLAADAKGPNPPPAGGGEAASEGGEPSPEHPADKGFEGVPVTRDLLAAARERTGIQDAAELVAFALSLLMEPDPAAEFLREERGSLPADFRLDF